MQLTQPNWDDVSGMSTEMMVPYDIPDCGKNSEKGSGIEQESIYQQRQHAWTSTTLLICIYIYIHMYHCLNLAPSLKTPIIVPFIIPYISPARSFGL